MQPTEGTRRASIIVSTVALLFRMLAVVGVGVAAGSRNSLWRASPGSRRPARPSALGERVY
jgi:hypothetical protein